MSATRRLKRAKAERAFEVAGIGGWEQLPRGVECPDCDATLEVGLPSPNGDGYLTICTGCGAKRKLRAAVFGEATLGSVGDMAGAAWGVFVGAFARVFGRGGKE